MAKLGNIYIRVIAFALLCCSNYNLIAQAPIIPTIKEVKVYGNSAQFFLRTMGQINAAEATLNNRTRIKIRFRLSEAAHIYDSWTLSVKSLEPALQNDDGASSISLSDVELITSASTTANTSLTVNNITISQLEQTIAEGTWNAATPISNTDIMEAEIVITYKITGPFTGKDEGIYFSNLYFELKEQ